MIFLEIVIVSCVCFLVRSSAEKPPHIVIVLADDVGHDDVSFHGSQQIPTPNLDAMAYDGIILDNYYVHRLCTPSRAALMTGRLPIQLGLQFDVIGGAQPFGLPLNETLMPEYFKTLGYSTHMVGKWHLGYFAKEYTPTYRGFDSFYGIYQSRGDYYDHTYWQAEGWGLDLHNNTDPVHTEYGQYSTDVFAREAVKVIDNHNTSKPLLLYFAEQGVHSGNENTPTPLEAPWKYLKKLSHIQQKQRRIYAGMVSAVDASFGAVIKALHRKGILNDTIVFFSTDNGGPANGMDKNQACNWPLKGMKYTMWEGGVRGASFIWSPRLQKSGYVSKHMIQIEDILPTLLHAAGYNMSSLPHDIYGKNMWEALSYNTPSPRHEILHNINEQWKVKAVRVGDMKLVVSGTKAPTSYHDNWYVPPLFEEISKTAQNWTDTHEDFSSEEMHLRLKAYKTEMAPAEMFHSDIEQILVDMGRPKRSRSPVLVDCGEKPARVIFCNGVSHPCVYNITADPCEYKDLSSTRPEVVQELLERLAYYEKQAVPPRNKPSDPKGYPTYHNGVWEPWVDLTYDELKAMRAGKVL